MRRAMTAIQYQCPQCGEVLYPVASYVDEVNGFVQFDYQCESCHRAFETTTQIGDQEIV
jgi:predicted RNA-binding Zn-ribbon protein involved in translation (DUF1610 family)